MLKGIDKKKISSIIENNKETKIEAPLKSSSIFKENTDLPQRPSSEPSNAKSKCLGLKKQLKIKIPTKNKNLEYEMDVLIKIFFFFNIE